MFGLASTFGTRRDQGIRGLFAALDVGSSTVTCLLCHANGRGEVQVIGMGTRRAEGFSNGNVVNAPAAQQSILNAINQAEEVAGETTERVVLCANAGRPHSRLVELELEIDGSQVNQSHINSLQHYAKQPLDVERQGEKVIAERLNTMVIDYAIDGREGIQDPRGMSANVLQAKYLVVTAQKSALQSLIDCVERCHLSVSNVIATPLASAFGALNEEERQHGATLIDFGAQCTSIAAYHGGRPVHVEVLPTGSDLLTSDLAAALSCSLNDAERVKCLHGAAFLRPTDASVDVSVPSIDPLEAPTVVTRAYLVDVIQARLDELFDRIAKRLDHPKLLPFSSKRIVLTGGGSALVGIKDYVALRLGRATRLGRPVALDGISRMQLTPAQTSVVGTVCLATRQEAGAEALNKPQTPARQRGLFSNRASSSAMNINPLATDNQT